MPFINDDKIKSIRRTLETQCSYDRKKEIHGLRPETIKLGLIPEMEFEIMNFDRNYEHKESMI